jgi:hypothetical protein
MSGQATLWGGAVLDKAETHTKPEEFDDNTIETEAVA